MERLTRSQKRAQFFAALGHTRRLKILGILADNPKGIPFEAIETLSRIKGASLFHHLRPLRDAGLIDRKIKGRNTYYRLDSKPIHLHLSAMDAASLLKSAV